MTRCFSAMQVNITRCLHELAKETDRIAEIGSSDREIDETPDELPILSRLTRFGAEVRIKFEIAIERGCHGFALNHTELV